MQKMILVGANEGHLLILKKLKEAPVEGVEVLLIAQDQPFVYPPLIPSLAEGLIKEEELMIDVRKQCEQANVEYIDDQILSFDPIHKNVLTTKGEVRSYDVISFDVGKKVSKQYVDPVRRYAINGQVGMPVTEAMNHVKRAKCPVIVANAQYIEHVELAYALQAERRNESTNTSITLVLEGERQSILSTGQMKQMQKMTAKSGIKVIEGDVINQVTENQLTFTSGKVMEYDQLLWLNESAAHDLFAKASVPVDEEGFLLVNEFLQSQRFPSIFGLGDCTAIEEYPQLVRDKHHTRVQAQVVYHNLISFLKKREGHVFTPAKPKSSIISLGGKVACATVGSFSYTGKIPWLIKHQYDKKQLFSLRG